MYKNFLKEYRRVFSLILDEIWKYGYSWTDAKGRKHIFNVNKNLLNHPKFIDYNLFNIKTTLSARALFGKSVTNSFHEECKATYFLEFI